MIYVIKSSKWGPHLYEGLYIPRYGITVCRKYCYEGNWDGWAPHHEEKIIATLREKKLPIPERNEKGWLPRD